jgi:hypothetical protein
MTLSEAYIIAENYIKVENEYLAKYYPGCGYIKGMMLLNTSVAFILILKY